MTAHPIIWDEDTEGTTVMVGGRTYPSAVVAELHRRPRLPRTDPKSRRWCSLTRCDGAHEARGLCMLHYRRWYRRWVKSGGVDQAPSDTTPSVPQWGGGSQEER